MIQQDASAWVAKLRAQRAAGPAARRSAATSMVQHLSNRLVQISRKDTNRYVNGWIDATVAAGATQNREPFRKSRNSDALAKALATQLVRLENILAGLVAMRAKWDMEGRKHDRSYQRVQQGIDKQKQRVEIAKQHIENFNKHGATIVMTRGTGAGLAGYERRADSGKGVNVEVKHQIYGGTGRILQGQNTSVIIVHNLEPHSRVLEKRFGTLRTASAGLKAFGAKQGGATYLRSLLAASSGGARNVRI